MSKLNLKVVAAVVGFAVPVIVLLALTYAWRPLGIVHGPWVFFTRHEWTWVQPVIVTVLCTVVGLVIDGIRSRGSSRYDYAPFLGSGWGFGIGVTLGFIVFCYASFMVAGKRGEEVYKSNSYQQVDIKDLKTCQTRIAPWQVLENAVQSQYTSDQRELVNSHVLLGTDGRLSVSWEDAPQRWRQRTRGAGFMDMMMSAPKVRRASTNTDWEVGITNRLAFTHQGRGDALYWQAYKADMGRDLQETTMVETKSGEVVAVTPYLVYEGKWGVQSLGGVLVLHRDGRIEDLTPEQARKREEVVRSGHLVPTEFIRDVQEDYNYQHGWKNMSKLMGGERKDSVSIIDTDNDNAQPYLTDMCGQGLSAITIAKAKGRSRGVSVIMVTSTVTGKTQIVRASPETNWVDNQRAADLAFQAPEAVLQVSNKRTYQYVEPRPVIQNGRLYYLVSVISDGSPQKVARTVVVDADSSLDDNVVAVFNHELAGARQQVDADLADFIRTGEIEDQYIVDPQKREKKPTGIAPASSDAQALNYLRKARQYTQAAEAYFAHTTGEQE